MELRQLEYFIAVASELSFSRAAQRTHVVQSALSTSVGKLEKELGVKLFDRSKRRIRMTPAGELFRDHARQVIQASHLAKEALNDYRGDLTGTVDFGSLVSFGNFNLPKALGEFHRTYPLVRIRMRQGPFGSSAYLPSIVDGSLDLALISAPHRFPPQIDMRLLAQEEMAFVCRPDHSLAAYDTVRMADLTGEELIQFPVEYGLRRLIDEAFLTAKVEQNTPYEVSAEYIVAAGLVRHGLGTTFMPTTEARRFSDLCAIPLRPKVIWKIYLASLGLQPAYTATALLAKALLEEARDP